MTLRIEAISVDSEIGIPEAVRLVMENDVSLESVHICMGKEDIRA